MNPHIEKYGDYINKDLYERIATEKSRLAFHNITLPEPVTLTRKVDASQSEFPKWRKLKLNKSKFATE